jgi:predicted phage terminase large subunit-like protein
MDSENLVALTVAEAAQFDPDGLGIETNQFQHLLATQILEESKKQGNAIPIMQIYNNISKDVRIRRLGPYLANKLIKFKRNEGTRLLVAQLREFPLGKHDDGPDSLEMALRVMISMWNGKRSSSAKRIIA